MLSDELILKHSTAVDFHTSVLVSKSMVKEDPLLLISIECPYFKLVLKTKKEDLLKESV